MLHIFSYTFSLTRILKITLNLMLNQYNVKSESCKEKKKVREIRHVIATYYT